VAEKPGNQENAIGAENVAGKAENVGGKAENVAGKAGKITEITIEMAIIKASIDQK
jgi:hypothetical protein